MAQGERYDSRTGTGWKFENGRSNYYLKGKKLDTLSIVKRGLLEGGKKITSAGRSLFEPLSIASASAAKNLKDRMTRDPRSEIGDSVFDHNKKLLAIQKELDKNPNVIANQQALQISKSPAEYFGVNQYGAKPEPTPQEQAKQAWSMENLSKIGFGNNALLISGSGANLVKVGNESQLNTGNYTEEEEENITSDMTNQVPDVKNTEDPGPVDTSPNVGHRNYDQATTATGSAALNIQRNLLDVGFKQSELNKLSKQHKDKYGNRKGLLSILTNKKKKSKGGK